MASPEQRAAASKPPQWVLPRNKPTPKDIVVLTGFGPFKEHVINASWEAVKLVPSRNFETEINAHVVLHKIPVDYECVSRMVPELWRNYKPVLVVHVGVSSVSHCVTLETYARNIGYTKEDVNGKKPEAGLCCAIGPPFITSLIDLKGIAKKVQAVTGLKTRMSLDAGQYLCEYTYYKSLREDASSVVFVHVPVLGVVYTPERLAAAIKVVIKESLQEEKRMEVANM